MAEIDVFERSLAGAFQRLADDVPGAVDAAAVAHRVALEHPRRRPAVLRWRLIAVPRPVWVLLLLVGLLLALVGGALLVGSRLQRRLPAILPPIGQVYVCPPRSTPDKPGPVDQAGPPEADMGVAFGMAFDRRAGRLVEVTSTGNGVETWTFDVCTNTWAQMHPNREPPRFDWARLVYDVDSDAMILVAYTAPPKVWVYDLEADTWTERGAAPTYAQPIDYDPVSGLVVVAADGPWNYDVETDTWTRIVDATAAADPGWPGGSGAYDASVDRIVSVDGAAGHSGAVAGLFDVRAGSWSKSDAVAPPVLDWLTSPAIAYDAAAKRTVIGGNVGLAAYDASADRWESLVTFGPEYHGVGFVYDPVNERLVVFPDYWEERGGTQVGDVLAFDLATREWTVLLEPRGGQPAPSSR